MRTTLKRHKREYDAALREMTTCALELADAMIACAPEKPTDEDLAKVEDFVVDYVVTETKKRSAESGGGVFAAGFIDGPGVEAFKEVFGKRFYAQARLKTAEAGGTA